MSWSGYKSVVQSVQTNRDKVTRIHFRIFSYYSAEKISRQRAAVVSQFAGYPAAVTLSVSCVYNQSSCDHCSAAALQPARPAAGVSQY